MPRAIDVHVHPSTPDYVDAALGRFGPACEAYFRATLPPDHPLWRQPGVLISPHVGGASSAFFPRADRLMAAQLNRFMAGQSLENIVKAP